jgi:hypothetical protein
MMTTKAVGLSLAHHRRQQERLSQSNRKRNQASQQVSSPRHTQWLEKLQ